MGLFKKVKNILFDEEEVIDTKPLDKKVEVVKKPEIKEEVYTEYKPPVVKREEKPIVKDTPKPNDDLESTFPFPDFDEEEFDSYRPVVTPTTVVKPKPRTTNILDLERQKRQDKKVEYSRIEKVEETVKKKFKPSPIISPVYGVLNEDYVADDITNKGETIQKQELDVESVRRKAFGSLDEISEEKNVKKTYVETETVTSYEPREEKEKKVKTIDELLEDTSDVKIDLDDTEDIETEVSEPIKEKVREEEPRKVVEPEPIKKPNPSEDTLENDLFDLIDSMYDTREDGE